MPFQDLQVGQVLWPASRALVLEEVGEPDEERWLVAVGLLDSSGPRLGEGHAVNRREEIHAARRDAELIDQLRRGEVVGGEV